MQRNVQSSVGNSMGKDTVLGINKGVKVGLSTVASDV